MFNRRRTRLLTAFIALISLLFMQLAVASYACPGAETQAAEMAAMAEDGTPCAGAMALNLDHEQPNLCQAHCQPGEQKTTLKYELPPQLTMAVLPLDFWWPAAVPVSAGVALQASQLRRSTSPPLSIRNCCFRI